MENTNLESNIAYHQAKSELLARLRTMGLVALCRFILLRVILLGSEDVSNWELLNNTMTPTTALYLPYRVGYALTGTPIGGTVGAIAIMIWMSTWVADHEFLAWVLIVTGYLVDFGPWVYRLFCSEDRYIIYWWPCHINNVMNNRRF